MMPRKSKHPTHSARKHKEHEVGDEERNQEPSEDQEEQEPQEEDEEEESKDRPKTAAEGFQKAIAAQGSEEQLRREQIEHGSVGYSSGTDAGEGMSILPSWGIGSQPEQPRTPPIGWWEPPGDVPGKTPEEREDRDPTMVHVYSFTIFLKQKNTTLAQSTGNVVNPVGQNYPVVAPNVQEAEEFVREKFGDDLVNLRGGTPTFVGCQLVPPTS
jgi:hypothetical protein